MLFSLLFAATVSAGLACCLLMFREFDISKELANLSLQVIKEYAAVDVKVVIAGCSSK